MFSSFSKLGFGALVLGAVAFSGCSNALGIHELKNNAYSFQLTGDESGIVELVAVDSNAQAQVVDTVGGGNYGQGTIVVNDYSDTGFVLYNWHEARITSQSTGGSRIGLIARDGKPVVYDFGGQAHELVMGTRLGFGSDEIATVAVQRGIAFEGLSNLVIAFWDENGLVERIDTDVESVDFVENIGVDYHYDIVYVDYVDGFGEFQSIGVEF